MSYGLKYELALKSRVNGESHSLKISFMDYAGEQIDRNMPLDQAIVPKKDNSNFIKGTSIDFAIREEVDFEMDEFYTNDPKKILVQHFKGATCLWSGYNLPQQYEAMYKPAPVTIRFTATDGMGLLKDEDYKQTGTNSQLAMIVYCMDKIGLGLGFSIAMNLFETNHAENRAPIDQTFENSGIYSDKKCLDVLEDILEKYNAEITQVNNRWWITCSADKQSTRMLYTSAGVYEGTESAPAELQMGYPGEGVVRPVGVLSRGLEPGGKKVTLKHDFGRKKSFLDNYEFWRYSNGAFASWTQNGSFDLVQGIKDGKAYAMLGGRATDANNSIYQAVDVTNVPGEYFVFEIDFSPRGFRSATYTGGLLPVTMAVRMMVAISNGSEMWFLTKQGWTTDVSEISETVESSPTGPVWNRLKIITSALPISGTLQVMLYRYYTGVVRPGETYAGVAFSEPCVYFLSSTGELYPSGLETLAQFTGSKEPNDLGTKDLLAADAPNYSNKGLLYYNITRLANGNPTYLWHRLGSANSYSLLVQLARALASENRVAKEKLTGTIRGTDLNFASIILHNNKKFEIAEGSWDVYEETWQVTLRELLAWSNESITFETELGNANRETSVNSDGSVTGVGISNSGGLSPTQILEQVKTVDGAGSGMDADLLDGHHADYFATNARVDGIEAIMSTDTERLNAVNQLTASYTAADTSLNNTLTTALNTKAPMQNPSFSGMINSSGILNVVAADAGVKAYFTEKGQTIDENHENFILVGGYDSGYGSPALLGHHYNAGGGYGFLELYGGLMALKFNFDGSTEFFQSMKLGNWSFALDGNDLVLRYNGIVAHRFSTPVAGKSNILSTGGQGVNQSI